ncbi:MAG: alpha/beta fold hydrolase [Deltaproteobacteria bacterium]|nr:alpha/beta fold hydrolase [Deltaproteobacteria bacterium]
MSDKRVAVCFHGFLRTGAAMWWVSRRLRAAGYGDVSLPTFGYHLRAIEDNAALAAAAVRALASRHPGARIDLVTHSYGGVLARVAWAQHDLPALTRAVLVSPPNRGAVAAAYARRALPVHRFGWDPFGQILPGVPEPWPLPPGEVGILTGGTGTARGLNPMLGDDNDGTVRVDEARHDGAKDFLVMNVQHTMTIMAPRVLDRVVGFLDSGRF